MVHKCREDNQVVYSLTDKGYEIIRSNYKRRQLGLVKSILEHKVFNEALRFYVQSLEMPSQTEIIQIMHGAEIYRISAESTYERRSSTVASWINWILELQR